VFMVQMHIRVTLTTYDDVWGLQSLLQFVELSFHFGVIEKVCATRSWVSLTILPK